MNARCTRPRRGLAPLPLLLLWLMGHVAGAASPAAASATSTPPPAAATAPASPRRAIAGYLEAARAGDWTRAASYLDLRRFPVATRGERGAELARDLKTVIDQALLIDPENFSDDPEGELDDGLPPDLERLGLVAGSEDAVDILLQRVPASDGGRTWKVSASTLARVPALARSYTPDWLPALLPAVFLEVSFLGMALWQWIGILVVVAVAAAGAWLVGLLGAHIVRPIVRRSSTRVDDHLVATMTGPFRLGVALVLFAAGILLLGLPLPVRRFFTHAAGAAGIVVMTWVLLRGVDVLRELTVQGLTLRGRTSALGLVPVATKAAKALAVALGAIAILQNLGLNVTGILAGLGIGGLAIALAAQKTVENLFGGVTLLVDQPVRVGDFCRFGDRIGTVEEIGLRSTRVRTLDRTVVSIPNAEFAGYQLENFARRDRIWLRLELRLRYDTTPDQLRHVLVEVRRLLYAHPRISPDPARVRLVGLGASSLNLEVFAYVLTPDINEFLAIQEDLLLRIMDVVAASGTWFALPASTTYLARDGGRDPERTREAENQVAAWRQTHALNIPEFSQEAIAAVKGTLDYPPAGSAMARAAGSGAPPAPGNGAGEPGNRSR